MREALSEERSGEEGRWILDKWKELLDEKMDIDKSE